jgi:hypothetical protein
MYNSNFIQCHPFSYISEKREKKNERKEKDIDTRRKQNRTEQNRTEQNIGIRGKLKILITDRNGQILTIMIEMI